MMAHRRNEVKAREGIDTDNLSYHDLPMFVVEMRHKPVRALRLIISYSYQKMKYTKMKIGNNGKHRQWLTIIMAKNLLKSIFMVEKCKIR